jgi:hypothetical protein
MKPTNKQVLLQLSQARPEQSALKFWIEETAATIAFICVVAVLYTLIYMVT